MLIIYARGSFMGLLRGCAGRGTWGEVKLVIDKQTKARRAAKKIPKCYIEDVDRFRQEVDIMKSLDHPNIVRLFETFEDLTDFYLVMEYCSGGELFDRLIESGVLTESMACTIMKQILAAVAYCHMHRVAHRDLKPENFLFLTDQPNSPMKLIDFGLAARFKPGQPMRTRAGTPYYVSPQVSSSNELVLLDLRSSVKYVKGVNTPRLDCIVGQMTSMCWNAAGVGRAVWS